MAVAQEFLDKWKQMIDTGDRSVLEDLVADDATFRSPAFWAPKQSKEYLMTVLGAVNSGFDEFNIVREWVQDDRIIFEFDAKLGEIGMKGIDILSVNDEGKLQELEVLIRPINALMAMAEHVKGAFKQPGAAA